MKSDQRGINEISYFFWSSLLTVNTILVTVLVSVSIVQSVENNVTKWLILGIVLCLLFSSTLLIVNFQWQRELIKSEAESKIKFPSITKNKILDNEKIAVFLLFPAAFMIVMLLANVLFSKVH